MVTCNRLDSETLGSQPTMPQNHRPGHGFLPFCGPWESLGLVGEILFTLGLSPTCWTGRATGEHMAVSREIFGHNQSRSQSVTCSHLFVFPLWNWGMFSNRPPAHTSGGRQQWTGELHSLPLVWVCVGLCLGRIGRSVHMTWLSSRNDLKLQRWTGWVWEMTWLNKTSQNLSSVLE